MHPRYTVTHYAFNKHTSHCYSTAFSTAVLQNVEKALNLLHDLIFFTWFFSKFTLFTPTHFPSPCLIKIVIIFNPLVSPRWSCILVSSLCLPCSARTHSYLYLCSSHRLYKWETPDRNTSHRVRWNVAADLCFRACFGQQPRANMSSAGYSTSCLEINTKMQMHAQVSITSEMITGDFPSSVHWYQNFSEASCFWLGWQQLCTLKFSIFY